jgi:hypothetical protein
MYSLSTYVKSSVCQLVVVWEMVLIARPLHLISAKPLAAGVAKIMQILAQKEIGRYSQSKKSPKNWLPVLVAENL